MFKVVMRPIGRERFCKRLPNIDDVFIKPFTIASLIGDRIFDTSISRRIRWWLMFILMSILLMLFHVSIGLFLADFTFSMHPSRRFITWLTLLRYVFYITWFSFEGNLVTICFSLWSHWVENILRGLLTYQWNVFIYIFTTITPYRNETTLIICTDFSGDKNREVIFKITYKTPALILALALVIILSIGVKDVSLKGVVLSIVWTRPCKQMTFIMLLGLRLLRKAVLKFPIIKATQCFSAKVHFFNEIYNLGTNSSREPPGGL